MVLTFDDRSIESWHAALSLFEPDVSATFFVTETEELSEVEWVLLDEIAAAGHEIAAHARGHVSVRDYCGEGACSADEVRGYIDEIIVPHLADFDSHGFHPTSFAHPHGGDAPEATEALLQYFDALRDTTKGDLPYNDRAFWTCEDGREFAGTGIDAHYGHESQEYERSVGRAFCQDEHVIWYGHRIALEEIDEYTSTPDRIAELIGYAQARGLPISRFDRMCGW